MWAKSGQFHLLLDLKGEDQREKMHFYFILFVCPVPKVSVQKTSALQQL